MPTAGTQLQPVETVVKSLEDTAARALDIARRAGAQATRIEVDQVESRTAVVRNRAPAERNFHLASEISIAVYWNGRRASTSSSDLSDEGLRKAVRAALDITQVSASDPAAGLAEPAQLASGFSDLDLYHPLAWTLEEMMACAQQAEGAAFAQSPSISASNGASLHTTSGVSLLATSNGFCGYAPWSQHAIACAPVASSIDEKQMGYWGDSARRFAELAKPEDLGALAAKRALDALGAKRIPTQQCAVLLEPMAAIGLIAELVTAVSGDALYRTGSFLKDRLGTALFPPHVQIDEDPFLKRAMASRCFDSDGIAGARRMVVQDGCLQGFFLALYSARRLGLAPTGHGYGPHNLRIRSRLTARDDDFNTMLKKLNRGLVVRETVGVGVNRLTGDFSCAAQGFWVENAEVQFPVTGITLASNLNDMFGGLQAIGADTITRGAATSGSWLIEVMKVGGD